MNVYHSAEPDMLRVCMAHARLHAQLRSKDPNTKVGAVVYDPKSGTMIFGYNGFPAGIPDLKHVWDCRDPKNPVTLIEYVGHPERNIAATKYSLVVHAETAAVRKALMQLGDLSTCILVVTHFPCNNCMKDVILPSGLRHVVYGSEYPANPLTQWMAETAGCILTPMLDNPECKK
jgi:dCMP deaminase